MSNGIKEKKGTSALNPNRNDRRQSCFVADCFNVVVPQRDMHTYKNVPLAWLYFLYSVFFLYFFVSFSYSFSFSSFPFSLPFHPSTSLAAYHVISSCLSFLSLFLLILIPKGYFKDDASPALSLIFFLSFYAAHLSLLCAQRPPPYFACNPVIFFFC